MYAAGVSGADISIYRARYVCYAQSVDLRNRGIVLLKPWIHGLFVQSRDCPYIYFNPINSHIS